MFTRKKYVNPYDAIEWVPLDIQYKSSGLGGPIFSSISYGWANLLGEYSNVVDVAIGNLIHLSFAVVDEGFLKSIIIERALEKFDKEETGTFKELEKKRNNIKYGLNFQGDYTKYRADVEQAKRQTILNLLENLHRDANHECFPGLAYHGRDEDAVIDQIMNLCHDVQYLNPDKFSNSDNHEADVGPWIYNNLLDYFTTKISYIV